MTDKTFTPGDQRASLAPLSRARRAAVLYTLDTQTTLGHTILLGAER
jgi:hypothetical protein